MGFARPEFLWLLTILVPLSIWTIRGRWRRRKRWQSLAQRGRPSRDGTPGIVAAIVCLIIALAQPRWGNLPGSALPPGHDLVLMIDVSQSMAAEDAVPNRLAVAVEMAESLVKSLGRDASNRAAVVAFAGRGVRRCPLTENFGAVLDALPSTASGSSNRAGPTWELPSMRRSTPWRSTGRNMPRDVRSRFFRTEKITLIAGAPGSNGSASRTSSSMPSRSATL